LHADGSENILATLPSRGGFSEMRRYYFHIKRGQVIVLDHEGTELVDLAGAAEEAVRRGRQIVVRGPSTSSGSVIVADNNWQTLFEVFF
jgi:hypothetical protein